MDKTKNELMGIVMKSLVIGFQSGHITKEQYHAYLQEVRDMQNDSPEEIRSLVELIGQERGKENGWT